MTVWASRRVGQHPASLYRCGETGTFSCSGAARRSRCSVRRPRRSPTRCWSWAAPFAADALSYLASLVTLPFIKARMQASRPTSTPSAPRRLQGELGEGLAWTWRQPFLRYSAFFAAAVNILLQILTLGLIVLARTSSVAVQIAWGSSPSGRCWLGSCCRPWRRPPRWPWSPPAWRSRPSRPPRSRRYATRAAVPSGPPDLPEPPGLPEPRVRLRRPADRLTRPAPQRPYASGAVAPLRVRRCSALTRPAP